MFDYSELYGKIRAVYGTQEAFAEAMGMSLSALSQRLNGKIAWRTPEIVKACELLGIPLEHAHLYFFVLNVVKSQHLEEA